MSLQFKAGDPVAYQKATGAYVVGVVQDVDWPIVWVRSNPNQPAAKIGAARIVRIPSYAENTVRGIKIATLSKQIDELIAQKNESIRSWDERIETAVAERKALKEEPEE